MAGTTFQDVAVANLGTLFNLVARPTTLTPTLRLIVTDARLFLFGVVISHRLEIVELH